MRVLHVFKTYLPDNFAGIERVIWQIAESTAPLGIATDVLALSARPEAAPFAVGQHRVHQARLDLYLASTGISLSLFGAFRRLLAEADLVHYHFPWPMMDLLHLSLARGKPAVVTYHSDIVRQQRLALLYRPLMDRFLRSVDAIVATSPDYVASSPVLARQRPGQVSVIPIGIDDAIPAGTAERVTYWQQRLGGQRFFLFVGALRYYKGLEYLLEAARRSGLPVVIAGAGDPAIAHEASTLANVTTLGAVDEADKHALLALCTAFVFPSHLRSEAFGVALLEAARAGKPMISSAMGTGTSFVNLDGVTGLTVPPGNAEQLAAAMTRLWHDPQLAADFGVQARARYESVFTAAAMGAAYARLYRQVLLSRSLPREA